MNIFPPCKNNIGEIALFGTGGGYGESCVVHLGNQNWIVIDSCINPYTTECLPLDYLRKKGVNIANDVKLIICTHWHDDHIKGISQLLKECFNCQFVISKSIERKKFLQLVSLDYKKIKKETSNSSTTEFNKCLEILKDRKTQIIDALKDRILFSLKTADFTSEVISLSPSDYSVMKSSEEISTLITDYGATNKKIISSSPNSRCIAIYLKLGTHRALLGADLESNSDNRLGWSNVVEFNQSIDKKSAFFKISHHGSINGHDDRIWTTLLEPDTVGTLTPYNKSKSLPTQEMIKKFNSLCENVYITSNPIVGEKPKKRERDFEKLMLKFKQRIKEVKFRNGIIISQIDLQDNNSLWNITLFENAMKLS